MKRSVLLPVIILIATTVPLYAQQFAIDVEGAYVASIPYNKVRIPASGGTQFDLAGDLDPQNTFAFRARVNYTIKTRHVISALYAPLTIRSSGAFNRTVNYSDEVFAAGTNVSAVYKFNSYRLTYRYMIIANDNMQLGFGVTAKVRDANISIASESKYADFPDLGIVPLINFYFSTALSDDFNVVVEGDALATRQGRAEDIFAGVTYGLTAQVDIKGGYRILEGGANVERNYNFSWINYAALGIVIDL